jgi:hypothetical protein
VNNEYPTIPWENAATEKLLCRWKNAIEKFISVLSYTSIADFGANCTFQMADLDRAEW